MSKVLHREVIDAHGLLKHATALNLLYKLFFDSVVVVEVAAHSLPILLGQVFNQRLFKLSVVNAMALLVPDLIHVLHVAAEATVL